MSNQKAHFEYFIPFSALISSIILWAYYTFDDYPSFTVLFYTKNSIFTFLLEKYNNIRIWFDEVFICKTTKKAAATKANSIIIITKSSVTETKIWYENQCIEDYGTFLSSPQFDFMIFYANNTSILICC